MANYCNEPIKLNGSLPLVGQPVISFEQELVTAIAATQAATGPLQWGPRANSNHLGSARQHLVLVAGTSEGMLKRIVVTGLGLGLGAGSGSGAGQSAARGHEFDALRVEQPAQHAQNAQHTQQSQWSAQNEQQTNGGVLQDLQLSPAVNPQLVSSSASQRNGYSSAAANAPQARHQFALLATQHKVVKVRVNGCKASPQLNGNATGQTPLASIADQCLECAALQDPFCGWCAPLNACVARDQCLASAMQRPNGSAAHWAPFDALKCDHYRPVWPQYLALEGGELGAQPAEGASSQRQQVDVNVRLAEPVQWAPVQLGAQLAAAHFACHFDFLAHWAGAAGERAPPPQPSGATTKAAQARLNPNAGTVSIGCPLPPAAQRPLDQFAGPELRVRLTVRLLEDQDQAAGSQAVLQSALGLATAPGQSSGAVPAATPTRNAGGRGPGIERELVLYACQRHTSCRACVTAGAEQVAVTGRRTTPAGSRPYACQWCPLGNRCTFNASHPDFGCAASAIASTTPASLLARNHHQLVLRGSQLAASLDRVQASVLGLALERPAQCPAADEQSAHAHADSAHSPDSPHASAAAASRAPADGLVGVAGNPAATVTSGSSVALGPPASGGNGATEILVAHNSRRALHVPLRQPLETWPQVRDQRVLRLECLLELEGAKGRFSARLAPDNHQLVVCQESLFAYQAEQATQRAQLQVILNDAQVIETSEGE